MPIPIDTSTTSIPTPEASATTTSAKKKKKKKKKKSKSGSEAGSLSASTPTSPMIGPDEEDEEIPGPPTPSDSTEDNNGDHNLPPTPLSASGVLPLLEETPEAVAIEEAATVPMAVVKDEPTEDKPAKMEVVPILEEEPTVEPLEEEKKAAAADEPVAGGKDDEAHGKPESDVAAPVADEPVHETTEPIKGDVVAVDETVAKAEPTAEVAEPEKVNQTTEHTELPHSESSEAKDEEETTEHPPKAEAPDEDIVAILDEPKAEETAETPDDNVEKEDETPGGNPTPTEPAVEETPTVEETPIYPDAVAEDVPASEGVAHKTEEAAPEATPKETPEAEEDKQNQETPNDDVISGVAEGHKAEHVEETSKVEEVVETAQINETTPEATEVPRAEHVEATPGAEEVGETSEVAPEVEHVEETPKVEEVGEAPEVAAEAEHVEETPGAEEVGETPEVAAEAEHVEEAEVEEAGETPEISPEADHIEEATPKVEEAGETAEVAPEAEHVEETTPKVEEAGETPEVAAEAEHVEEVLSYPDVAAADDAPKTEEVASETEQATSEIAEEADAPQTEIEQSYKTEETPEKEVLEAEDVSQIAETTKADEGTPADHKLETSEPVSAEEVLASEPEAKVEHEEPDALNGDEKEDLPKDTEVNLETVTIEDVPTGEPTAEPEAHEEEAPAHDEVVFAPVEPASEHGEEKPEKKEEANDEEEEIVHVSHDDAPLKEVTAANAAVGYREPGNATERKEDEVADVEQLDQPEPTATEEEAEVAETAAEAAGIAEKLDQPEPTATKEETEVAEKLDEPEVEATEVAESTEEPSQEVKANPLSASESGESPINLHPGEGIPKEITAEAISTHVELGQESYESEEPSVPVVPQEIQEEVATEPSAEDLSREFKVAPLPAFENAENPIQLEAGEPIPDNITTASIQNNVKLDKESYESEEPNVPSMPAEETLAAAEKEEEQEVKVAPLPAFENAENPMQLTPGELIPENVTVAGIYDNVRLEIEAYESEEPTVPLAPVEEASPAADRDQEVKVTPLPAFENAENPIQLAPGEPVPDLATASIDEHVRLDKESFESTEPTVPVVPVGDLEQEAKVVPLPAFRNAENPIQLQPGEPIPEVFATAAAQDHVKLDQESYENTAPSVPIVVPKETNAETVQEVADTLAEVANVAQKLDEPTPEEAKSKAPAFHYTHPVLASPGWKLISRKDIEPTSDGVQVQEPAANAKDAPGMLPTRIVIAGRCTDYGIVTPTKDKTAVEPARETTGVDLGDLIVPGTFAGTMVAAAATVLSRKPNGVEDKPVESPNVEHLVDETVSHKKPDASPVTKAVDESTAHRSAGEELITEPAPQAPPSSVHGEIIPEADVPKILLDTKATQGATPTVMVSSPVTPEDDGQSARTVEIVQPTPAGEIFTGPVWNQSVSPFLQYSLENSPEGIRQRKGLAAPSTHERPASSGSDIVSARGNHNIMRNFWQVFFFGWIGGMGRFFSGFFGRKKEKSAAKAAAAATNAGATPS